MRIRSITAECATRRRAGQTLFVAPGLVKGTRFERFKRIADLDTAWEKAVYAAFVVSEVDPFGGGNGRTGRATMSSYLDAAQEPRIIVLSPFRNDYLDGLVPAPRTCSELDDPIGSLASGARQPVLSGRSDGGC